MGRLTYCKHVWANLQKNKTHYWDRNVLFGEAQKGSKPARQGRTKKKDFPRKSGFAGRLRMSPAGSECYAGPAIIDRSPAPSNCTVPISCILWISYLFVSISRNVDCVCFVVISCLSCLFHGRRVYFVSIVSIVSILCCVSIVSVRVYSCLSCLSCLCSCLSCLFSCLSCLYFGACLSCLFSCLFFGTACLFMSTFVSIVSILAIRV